MKLRYASLTLVLVIVITVGAVLLNGPSNTSKLAAVAPSSVSAATLEAVTGCREFRLDHGHDVDVHPLLDLESDECVAGVNHARLPDGVPAN